MSEIEVRLPQKNYFTHRTFKLCYQQLLVAMSLMLGISGAHSREMPTHIPAIANIGAGYGDYKLHNAYQGRDSWITGTQLSIRGVIEKDVLDLYNHKVPDKWRNMLAKLGEVSITRIEIPRTLYIHPFDGEKEAYGATWGLVPGVGLKLGFVKFRLSGGLIATYLYQHDTQLDESSHFLRPGLRGDVSLSTNLFSKYLILEGGVLGDVYWPGQSMFGNDKVYRVGANYITLHVRIPFKVKAPKA